MSEDGLSEPCDEHSMELFVESLTGTSFEMRVYSTDTVLDIKNKIFRVEGIPVPQQNLLFQMKELSDHSRLADVGIVNGCTLRLVTAMRGGPISTRRWTSDHMVWKDLKDLIEHTREELGDKLGTKVSVLVFKEGDVIKWLRVIENEDGSYSPYNEQRAIAPPCSSSGNDVGGCIGGRGGGGGSIGSRSGNKNYQHHKSPATDIATISSNTIDFQDLMQFKQHATALSYYHQQHQQHHYSHTHAIGPSTVVSGISDQLHQQHQYQRQQVYRRLEDDVRMKGRVKLLKARMQRAKRTKGKGLSTPLTSDDGSPLKGAAVVAEEIALGRRNNNLVLAAVLNDNNVDGINDTFKGDLPVETLLRALQSGETLVPINDRYTLASKYHRRTHNHNSHLLQLDTSQLPHDNLTLFKPIPTGHGSSKHGEGSSATYLVGSGNSTATRTTGSGGNANDNDPNLLLMGCSANTATAMAVIRSKTRNTNSSSNIDSSINNGCSNSTNDLEVALKEKHRSSRLRLLKATPDTNVDADAMGKRTKTTTIGRRLSNSIDPISSSNSINITTATTTTASPPPQSVLLNNAASNSSYSCTNLHVFEPQRDVITPGIRHDMTPKRRSSKTVGSVVESTATSMASAARDCTRERLSLPETKCRAKIGRLLNITAIPGSGETSDSDDGLWSQTAGSSAANKLRHYRSTALPLVLPDTTTIDKGKCANDINPSLLDDEQHIILPDIWKHHGIASITTPPSPNSIIEGTSFLCARATTTANSNSADTLASPTVVAMDSGDVEDCGIAAACLRDYIDMDSEFDKMISELRSAVPIPSIPSAIPPQYAPKDCQLYLGSPVVPRPAPASNQAATLSKSTTLTAATTTHRLSSMSTLPYHIHGLCSSPTAGTSTRRSPLYHRRTTSTTVTTAFTGTATVSPSTTNDDRTALAAAARSILEKVQRTTSTDIGGVAAIVADKAVRQRRRRYSTDDCEFTLERLQNDYVPDQFDYSDFDSCAADVDDMIGCYGQEAVVNARWMEAAAAASSTRSSGASPTQLPPTTRQRNSLRLRATAAHRDSPTDHHLHHHLCLAEQIQRLDLDTDDYRNEGVATSFSNAIGTRIGVMGSSRTANDNTSNTINIGEFSHSNFVSNGMVPCDNSIVGNTTKLPALVENRKQQQPAPDNMGVITAAERATGPRMRCAHCNRKLNITNIYDCRCGRIFCAQHRYSEVHDCAHDYKTEGRRLLAQQNPLVTAPKLAKF